MKTKKQILTTLFILIMARMAHAQMQVGATAGIGGATQSAIGNIYSNNDLFTGYNAGIILRKPLSESFALKTGLSYTLKGRSFDVKEEDKYIGYTDKFNYLVLPVKAEYSIPVMANRLFVAAGPYAGLLLDASQKTGDTTTGLNDQTKDFDFGLAFDLGFGKKCFSRNELQVSISYDFGLVKIAGYDENIRNKSLSFNVGFLF